MILRKIIRNKQQKIKLYKKKSIKLKIKKASMEVSTMRKKMKKMTPKNLRVPVVHHLKKVSHLKKLLASLQSTRNQEKCALILLLDLESQNKSIIRFRIKILSSTK